MADFSSLENFVMLPFSREVMRYCSPFSCGDDDLNSFFLEDSFLYADEMLGKTYCWITKTAPYKIVAMVTLANDSIKVHKMSSSIRNKVQRRISNPKRGRSYPAVLIGRIGVNELFRGRHLGSQILAFIKGWFCHEDNKTGCRFIVVDAYNKPQILQYYISNGFNFLFKSEADEKEYYDIDDDRD
ncbi:MAG: GNAT family N-acetyltransferase, partial [Bacteroides sp.]